MENTQVTLWLGLLLLLSGLLIESKDVLSLSAVGAQTLKGKAWPSTLWIACQHRDSATIRSRRQPSCVKIHGSSRSLRKAIAALSDIGGRDKSISFSVLAAVRASLVHPSDGSRRSQGIRWVNWRIVLCERLVDVITTLRKCGSFDFTSTACKHLLRDAGCISNTVRHQRQVLPESVLLQYYNCSKHAGRSTGVTALHTNKTALAICDALYQRQGHRFADSSYGSQYRDHARLRRSTAALVRPSTNTGLLLAPYIVASLPEDSAVGASVTPLYTISKSPLSFQITAGDDAGHFAINGSGVVYLVKSLDYEATEQYTLDIAVRQSSTSAAASPVVVVINVQDVNEFAPMFVFPTGMSHYQATLDASKMYQIGQPIAAVTVTDRDRLAPLRFTLSAGNQLNHFQISSKGQVSPTAAFGTSEVHRYELTVTVSDGAVNPRHRNAKLQITVLPNANSEILFVPGRYSASITENSAAVPSLLQVQAVNANLQFSSGIHYMLESGNEFGLFTLDPASGVLAAAAHFDRESRERYELQVMARSGHIFNRTTITVNVRDLNDNPSFTGGHRTFELNNFDGSLTAGVIGNVGVIDADIGSAHRCKTLYNDAPALFSVVSATCQVRLLKSNPPAGTYRAMVSANDGLNKAVNSTVQIHIISVPTSAVQRSITISLAGSAEARLQTTGIHGLVSAVSQVTGAATSSIYILGISDADKLPGSTDVTLAVQSQQRTSYISKDKLVAQFTANRGLFEQQIRANMTRLPVNLCSTAPCRNFAQCLPTVSTSNTDVAVFSSTEVLHSLTIRNSYRCLCKPGTTGTRCEAADDICYSQPCPSGARCQPSLSSNAGFLCRNTAQGNLVAVSPAVLTSTPSCPCLNNGTCQASSQQCLCPGLFSGANCAINKWVSGNTDRCLSRPCQNGGTCSSNGQLFTCTCTAGFVGSTCQQVRLPQSTLCDGNPCYHGAGCISANNAQGFSCQCAPGYTGPLCTWAVSGCSSHPCPNNVTCIDLDNAGDFMCDCMPGSQGVQCERLLDPCGSSPCQNNGQCLQASQGYACRCRDGFYGKTCADAVLANLCSSKPCRNGGNCTDGPGGYTCHCPVGYYGKTCSQRGTVSGSRAACARNPCPHGSSCVDMATGGYKCLCSAGYTGNQCEDNIDECLSSPCSPYATCHDAVNGYICRCVSGFLGHRCNQTCPAGTTGPDCTTPLYYCRPGRCQNGGSCFEDTTQVDGYRCMCATFYSGDNCRTALSCSTQPCKNGGTCTDMATGLGYTCSCLANHQGPNCELTTISSSGKGYIVLPPPRLGSRATVTMRFATASQQGLLYFGSQLQTVTANSYVAIEVSDGRVQATVQYAIGHLVRLSTTAFVADGKWHSVTLQHNAQFANLSVDSGISVQENYHFGESPAASGYLTLGLPLYIAGLPPSGISAPVASTGFLGCIGDILINSQVIDLATALTQIDVFPGCIALPRGHCDPNPCQHSQATCVNLPNGYTCSCPAGKQGTKCQEDSAAVGVSSGGYMKYSSLTQSTIQPSAVAAGMTAAPPAVSSPNLQYQMQVRPSPSTGEPSSPSILWFSHNRVDNSQYEAVTLKDNTLQYRTSVGGALSSVHLPYGQRLSLAQWSTIKVIRHSNAVEITLNQKTIMSPINITTPPWIDISKFSVYTAGIPSGIVLPPGFENIPVASFDGCIRDIRLNGNPLPIAESSSLAAVQWSVNGVSKTCAYTMCNPTCEAPYICAGSTTGEYQCVCPLGEMCIITEPPSSVVEPDSLQWYIYLAIGVGVLLAIIVVLVIVRHARSEVETEEDIAIKQALQAGSNASSPRGSAKVSLVFKNTEPKDERIENVADYSEEGGGENRDVPFDINLLLQEVMRPESRMSQSSSELYPQTHTAMTSLNSTANPTACPTPRSCNPNIFLPSYANSRNASRPTSRPTSQTASSTKLNLDDSRGKSRGSGMVNPIERVMGADRGRTSSRTSVISSQRTSAQGSRKMSPYTSGQSTPQYYRSTPSLALSQNQLALQQAEIRRTDVGSRRSPQGSSSKGSPSRSPPQMIRDEPQGLESLPGPNIATRQPRANQQSQPVPSQQVPDVQRRLQQSVQGHSDAERGGAEDRTTEFRAEGERGGDHDDQLSIEEDNSAGNQAPDMPDPRTLGSEFANISTMFTYDDQLASTSTPNVLGTQL